MELIPVFSVKVVGKDADVVVQATLPPPAISSFPSLSNPAEL